MSRKLQWSPQNPHPLSQMKTELVWEGKYDEFGNRREIDIAAYKMSMQKIETVDEPRQRAAAKGQSDMYEQKLMKIRGGGGISLRIFGIISCGATTSSSWPRCLKTSKGRLI